MEDLDIHYAESDENVVIAALARDWPRICVNAASAIDLHDVSPPHRIVVLVRPDCGLFFFTLETNEEFACDLASITSQLLESLFLESEDDFTNAEQLGRRIVTEAFHQAAEVFDFRQIGMPIGVDDYDRYKTAEPPTFQLLTE